MRDISQMDHGPWNNLFSVNCLRPHKIAKMKKEKSYKHRPRDTLNNRLQVRMRYKLIGVEFGSFFGN